VKDFIKDIDRAHRELEGFDNFRKWFRFPFLREGKTERGRDAIRAHLAKTGYKNGYVTVDNADWYMDDLLVKAVNAGKKFDESKLCSTYTSIMVDEAKFYDDMSVSVLGRSVKHVLLLHETDLNALCLGVLVSGLRAAGWNIVPADEAFNDPIALREPASMKLNQGRVVAMALDRGFSGSIWSRWNEEGAIEKEFARTRVWE